MKNLNKLFVSVLITMVLIISFPMAVIAEVPYKTFTIDGNKDVTETQTAYLPEGRLVQFGELMLDQPEDMKIQDNKIYIADTGNASIVVTDSKGSYGVRIGEGILKKPVGLDVVNNSLYVADETLGQVLEFDLDGNLVYTFDRPIHPSFGKSAPFTPNKVTADERGNVYVISRGNSNGMIQLNKNTNNEFLGYFSPNLTSVSFMTAFRRLIFTEEQLSRMLNIIPNSPVNLTMDKEGLIYTITPQDNRDVLKKLNMAGRNIISTHVSDRMMSGIAVGPYENIFTVSSNGYIYEFNREGNLLFIFGGKDSGQQRLGLFTQVSAIQVDDENMLYVLDQSKGEVQMFKSTEFSDKVHEALILYQDGNYSESKDIWEDVLKVNSLFDFANLGMGEAHFKEENYSEALNSYKLSRNIPGYSQAYWELRNVQIRQNVIPFLGVLLSLIIIKKILGWVHKRYPIKSYVRFKTKIQQNSLYQKLMFSFYYMKHPIDGSYGIKRENKTSNVSVLIIATIALLISSFSKYFTGFIFSTVKAGEFSLINDALITFIGFMFITTATYLVCTINDGESTYKNLVHGFVYSLTPYIVIKPILVFFSNYLTLNEAFLISFGELVIIAWVATLIFVTIRDINNYENKETIKIILLSIFTILIGILIIFVLFLLVNQLLSFIQAFIREAVYRIEN